MGLSHAALYDFLYFGGNSRPEDFLLLDDSFQGAFRYHTSLCCLALSGTQRSEALLYFNVCIDFYGSSNETALFDELRQSLK